MFNALEMAPPDAIMGINDAFKNDPNPKKINLTLGVYKDASGNTPIFKTVKKAEARLLEQEKTKVYVGIPGSPEFGAAVCELMFGAGDEIIASKRAAAAHTPGGTGALRVAGDFIKKVFPSARLWMSQPTWENHGNVFRAAGIAMDSYPYYDGASASLAFDKMLEALREIPAGDVVLLHGCCHNPTGVDPSPDQWNQIAAVAAQRKLLPLVDLAYQGLGDGLEEDVAGLRAICAAGNEVLIASSFSKNFGVYCERVGALTVVGASADAAAKAFSQIKTCIRANYSNPPFHGAEVVKVILRDPALRAEWEGEVAAIRDRISTVRRQFVERLKAIGVKRDFSFIMKQKGMFSFSGLTKEQVDTLRTKYAIYMVGSGRINVAGINEKNIEALCTAIAEVIA